MKIKENYEADRIFFGSDLIYTHQSLKTANVPITQLFMDLSREHSVISSKDSDIEIICEKTFDMIVWFAMITLKMVFLLEIILSLVLLSEYFLATGSGKH